MIRNNPNNIAHLCEKLPLDVGCGSMLNHAIYKRDALLIEPVSLLGLTILSTISALIAKLRGTR